MEIEKSAGIGRLLLRSQFRLVCKQATLLPAKKSAKKSKRGPSFSLDTFQAILQTIKHCYMVKMIVGIILNEVAVFFADNDG